MAVLTNEERTEQVRRSIDGVLSGIDTCLAHAAEPERLTVSNPAVSSWSVALQVEHLVLADEWILGWVLEAAAAPNPDRRREALTTLGSQILASGHIPRGKGPAPEQAMPQGIPPPDLLDRLTEIRGLGNRLGPRATEIRACRETRPHHVLGHFTPAEWLRFAHIHHDHHEAIIRDILA